VGGRGEEFVKEYRQIEGRRIRRSGKEKDEEE
jgi:hypothetical protein